MFFRFHALLRMTNYHRRPLQNHTGPMPTHTHSAALHRHLFFLCEILIILFVNNQGTDTNSTSIKSNRLWFLSTLSLALNLAATLWVLLRAHPHAQIRSRYFEHCSQLWQKKKKIPEFTPPFSTFISGIKPECIAVRPSHSPPGSMMQWVHTSNTCWVWEHG